MKRIFCLFLLVTLMLFLLSGCDSDIAMLYTESATVDHLRIEINKLQNCCFASVYEYDGTEAGLQITIPDDCNGIPVVKLGGFIGSGAPSPFFIALSCYLNAEEGSEWYGVYHESLTADYPVENIVFSLHIGKNIKEMDFLNMDTYYPHVNEDGSILFYHPVVEVTCSEENPYYYAEDGKLYEKTTDKLVDVFDYAADD